MVKPVFSILAGYPIGGVPDDIRHYLAGAGPGRSQSDFELAEGRLKGIKIRRVERQVQQAGFNEFDQPGHFIGRQVIGNKHVIGHKMSSSTWLRQAVDTK